jgi:putative flavoprotein involved in K+ transport
VDSVRRTDGGFDVVTGEDRWTARHVVIATGWCDRPAVPAMARQLEPTIEQVVPSAYRRPDSLPDGGVLVVGASATGVQIADELRRAGRTVLLAVGNHTRLPRRYRGMDIYWWLERTGSLDRTIEELPDPRCARAEPSLQLVGRPDHANLDLTTLAATGVELAGRLLAIDGRRMRFGNDLPATIAAADARLRRVLAGIDAHIDATGLGAEVLDPEPQRTLRLTGTAGSVDLRARGITSVIWATGHRRSYPWLHVPVLDAAGEIRQHRGVTPVPGLYVLGQRFQHFRNSNFIDGVGRDAAYIADCVAAQASPTIPSCHA